MSHHLASYSTICWTYTVQCYCMMINMSDCEEHNILVENEVADNAGYMNNTNSKRIRPYM